MSKAQAFPSASDAERPTAATARVFVRDKESEAVIRQCLTALDVKDAQYTAGNLAAAAACLAKESSPQLLILDVSGLEDPLLELRAIADVCDPSVAVIAIGDRNEIGFYRELKNAGISEYFPVPLQRDLLGAACKAILFPDGFSADRRTGELIYVVGVRGGAGATTVATSLAWSLAEHKRRHTVLVDLGLQTGDAALQLDAVPDHALCDALGHPERVDKLLLERGLKHITNRLSLFASLEPLNIEAPISEESFLWLLSKLLPSYRFTIVEVPASVAMRMTWALRIPSTCLLVSNASLSGARIWRDGAKSSAPTPRNGTPCTSSIMSCRTAVSRKPTSRVPRGKHPTSPFLTAGRWRRPRRWELRPCKRRPRLTGASRPSCASSLAKPRKVRVPCSAGF